MNKLILACVFFSFVSLFSQKNITRSQAINIISKQSMLSQRMAKDKIYKTNNRDHSIAQIELASSIILFEKNINTLKNMNFSDNIHQNIIAIELQWLGYKKSIIENSFDSEKRIMNFNEFILNECNTVYLKILEDAKKFNSYPYNTKNRSFSEAVINTYDLKYLSQRLALYYTSYFFKVNKFNHQDFQKIIDDIDFKIQKASIIKNTNKNVATQTNELEIEWKNTKILLNSIIQKEFISVRTSPEPVIIFEKCNKLLKSSDQLSRTYKAINVIH